MVPGEKDSFREGHGKSRFPASHGMEVVDSHGCGTVGPQDKVGLTDDQIPGMGSAACVGRENLLGQGQGRHQPDMASSRASMVPSTSSIRISPMCPIRIQLGL